ncbi:MAG: sulfur carrier protein ThiS [Proteobacteria bacterium]|nr:sulfur carrier protein ThiS [Pseudomonadota bacterium]
MQILLNGAPRECAPATTLAGLLEEAGYGGKRVAIEVNREIVPRSLHANYALDEGDRVEVIHAVGGG